MFHSFQTSIAGIELPRLFTYPFHYTPHPLCVMAAGEVQAYICLLYTSDAADEL